MQEDPDELKQPEDRAGGESSSLDKGILTAIERMLKPLRDDIKDLLTTQPELNIKQTSGM